MSSTSIATSSCWLCRLMKHGTERMKAKVLCRTLFNIEATIEPSNDVGVGPLQEAGNTIIIRCFWSGVAVTFCWRALCEFWDCGW